MELNRNFLKPIIKGGEPMLSKRNMYPDINSVSSYNEIKNLNINNITNLNNLLKIISLIDGKRSLKEISSFLNISTEELLNTVEVLLLKKIVK